MTQRAKAAICRALHQPAEIEEIEVEAPRHGEVMIKLAACGICHSDLSVIDGTLPLPLPIILGHEGAGVVCAVGEGVDDFAVGDHVLAFSVSTCGKCRYCTSGRATLCDQTSKAVTTLPDGSVRTYDRQGNPLGILSGCGVLAEYATLHEDNVIKIDADMPLDKASLVSCGVITGVGAAINTAKVEPGSICVVIGAGGVGLNTIQGCAIAGAAMIVAVDTSDFKLELARQFGATHTVNASREDNVVKTVKQLTGGADYSFECIGFGTTVAQAYGVLGKGGTAVVVGVAKPDDTTSIRTRTLAFEQKTIKGSYIGSARPHLDFPRLINLYKAGKLKLDELITRTYSIDDAPQAFADLVAGKNARGVVIFD